MSKSIRITIELEVERLSEVIDRDSDRELESHVRNLCSDADFYAAVLGCTPNQVPDSARVTATVDFGKQD